MTPHQWKKVSNHSNYATICDTEDGKQMIVWMYLYKCIRCSKIAHACEQKSGNFLFIDSSVTTTDCDIWLIKSVIES